MKNWVFVGIPLLLIFACTPLSPVSTPDNPESNPENNPVNNPEGSQEVTSLMFRADGLKIYDADDPQTKAGVVQVDDNYAVLWSARDTLGIYPETGAQVYFVTTTSGQTSSTFDGGGWGFKSSVPYYSYFPFIGNIYLDRHHIPISYASQIHDGVNDNDVSEGCFMFTDAVFSSEGKLVFNYHHLGVVLRIRTILPAGTYTRLAVTAPSDAFMLKGWYDLVEERQNGQKPVVHATEMSNQVSIKLKDVTLDSQTQVIVYLMIPPVNLKNTEITVSVLNSERKEYQQKKTPSYDYTEGVYLLGCTNLEEVPQTMGLILGDWGDGGNLGGTAN